VRPTVPQRRGDRAGSVLYLARAATAASNVGGELPHTVRAAIGNLATGLTLAESDLEAAIAHAAARACASDLDSAAHSGTDVVLANAIQTCADDLQQLISLHTE
jgi:hypothetical protein